MSHVRRMYGDSKYHNFALYEWVESHADWRMSIVRRPEGLRAGSLSPFAGRRSEPSLGCQSVDDYLSITKKPFDPPKRLCNLP
jgi:hypothetical protein